MILAHIDPPGWDFPVGAVDNETVVFDEEHGTVASQWHHPDRWPRVVHYVVTMDDAPVGEPHVVLMQAHPFALVERAAAEYLPWSRHHSPFRWPCATATV
jgi:hypothetical protein